MVEAFDATSKGSLYYLTGTKVHYQPDFNDLSTFHILGDGWHCDLVIPFGHVFPKDAALNQGFVASLQEYHLAMQSTTQTTMPLLPPWHQHCLPPL